MNTTKNRLIQKLLLSKKAKSKKQNGFTLIELMVVVAIVGALTAVGLPELTKATNRAKDSAAEATLVNAAKECSINLLTLDASTAETEFAATQESGAKFELVDGVCKEDEEFTIASVSGDKTYTIKFIGSVPNAPQESATEEVPEQTPIEGDTNNDGKLSQDEKDALDALNASNPQ